MFHCRSVSHHHTELIVREPLTFTADQQAHWLSAQPGIEAAILSTCNRLELYAHVPTPGDMDQLWADLLGEKHIRPAAILPQTVSLSGYEAARHLFRVSCGLESMALGEPQILGQVMHAYQRAHDHDRTAAALSLLFRAAIHAAKRAQAETGINNGSASVSSLGITKAENRLGSLAERSVLVIGAGEMALTVVKGLAQRGVTAITVLSRTFETARALADEWHICARPVTDLKDALIGADVVFTTSSAPFTILSRRDMEPIMRDRPARPLCIVDIALPRDVDADVASVPGVCLYDLDDLQHVADENLAERQALVPSVERIIDEELERFWQDYQGRTVAPTIRKLRERAEQVRQAELARIYNRLPPDSDLERDLFDQFSHRFMNKMLHDLTRNLKSKAGQDDGSLFAAVARDLFGLEDNPT
jgi:glutamyl-tRNA reductase